MQINIISGADRAKMMAFIREAYPIQVAHLLVDTPESCGPLIDMAVEGRIRIVSPLSTGEKRIGMLRGEKWIENDPEPMKAAMAIHALTETFRRERASVGMQIAEEKLLDAESKRQRKAAKRLKEQSHVR